MIDRPYTKMTRLLRWTGLGLALFLPLLLAACDVSQAAVRSESAGDVRTVPTAGALVDQPTLAAGPETPSIVPEEVQATPTTDPAAPIVPDFSLSDLDGETWTLSQFRGQPVMLFFWATW